VKIEIGKTVEGSERERRFRITSRGG